MLQKVKKETLVENIASAIGDYINSNENLEVGQKLPSEAVLCQQFGVSRTTIREALRILQAIGYVDLIPNRGAFVSDQKPGSLADMTSWMQTHANEIIDILEARLIIEPMAAALAAERATPEEKFQIIGISTVFAQETQKENVAALVLYDEKFHNAVVQGSHNGFVNNIYRIIADGIRNFRGRSFSTKRDATNAADAHQAIAAAIMAGDAESAKVQMTAHLEFNVSLVQDFVRNGNR